VWPRGLVAQVIPRGDGQYRIHFLPEFDQRCPPYAQIAGRIEDGVLRFDETGWSGQIDANGMTGVGLPPNKKKPAEFKLAKVTRLSPRLGAKPPAGAVVLFDGSGFDHWEPARGPADAEISWQLVDRAMRVWPPLVEHAFGASIAARKVYQDFRLHIEFRLPLLADVTGQTRGNSGVIFEDYRFHELQVLDSYGLPGYYDDCGGIYKVAAPKVNMCAPPLQWQSYDVVYHAPRYDDQGKLLRNGRMTVDHNGRRIHNDLELPGPPGGRVPANRLGTKRVGRIQLQHHGDPVEYRNIWLLPLEERTGKD